MSLLTVTLQESLEVALEVFILVNVLSSQKRVVTTVSILSIISGISIGILLFPPEEFYQKIITNFSFLFFISLLLVAPFRPKELMVAILVPVLLFLPQSVQTTVVLMDEIRLVGTKALFQLIAAVLLAGAALAGANMFIGKRLNLRRFMSVSEMTLFIATLHIIYGGRSEFTESSIVPTLQRGLTGFLAGLVSLLKDTLLIPTNRNLDVPPALVMDFFASPRFSMALTALILLVPPVYLFVQILLSPEPETTGYTRRAEIRKRIALYRGELLRRGTPVMLSFLSLVVLVHAANLTLNPTYEPEAVSIIAKEDTVRIPLIDNRGDISDGMLRKYKIISGESYRILLMMRPDGEVVVTLDACEICPPRGYVQRGRHLICKYCNTPIPVESLGQPGGCNPIPVAYKIEGDYVILNIDDLRATSEKADKKFKGRHYK